ncbi:MAG: hypothetical protein MJ072_04405 [Clostridia bacterium]|nr:hypothetical protein [Clostridia bacterium]
MKGDKKIKSVFAQSFIGNNAVDITENANIDENSITVCNISRKLWAERDHSSPACLIKIFYE